MTTKASPGSRKEKMRERGLMISSEGCKPYVLDLDENTIDYTKYDIISALHDDEIVSISFEYDDGFVETITPVVLVDEEDEIEDEDDLMYSLTEIKDALNTVVSEIQSIAEDAFKLLKNRS